MSAPSTLSPPETSPTPSFEEPAEGPVIEEHPTTGLEWMLGLQSGLSDRWQLEVGFEGPLPVFGTYLGTQLQLVGGQDSRFAAALRTQLAINAGGFSFEKIWIPRAVASLPMTVGLFEWLDITMAPQVMGLAFWRREPSRDYPDTYETMTSTAWAYGGALNFGVKIGGGRTLILEGYSMYAPPHEPRLEGAFQFGVGLGLRRISPPGESIWEK